MQQSRDASGSFFGTECEIFLGKIADPDDDAGGHDLGRCRKDMQMLDEKFQENVIEEEAEEDNQKVSEKLNASTEIGFRENNVTHQ